MQKYGFWVIPENEFYQELKEIITLYSKKYDAPAFVPHMAIFINQIAPTNEQVVNKVRQAANVTKPFAVSIGDVEFSTTYFQCVFARVRTNAHLLNAHLTLKNAFNIDEEIVYMPHTSLVYGNFDMMTREKIASEIYLKNTQFMANKITIVRMDTRDLKDWDMVEQVSFQ